MSVGLPFQGRIGMFGGLHNGRERGQYW